MWPNYMAVFVCVNLINITCCFYLSHAPLSYIPFHLDEDRLRDLGYDKTPDFKLEVPIGEPIIVLLFKPILRCIKSMEIL